MRALFAFLLSLPVFAASLPWKAGVAAVDITPRKSIWMAGYAARKKSSEGSLQPIYVKALALEDRSRTRAVLVTSDMLGFTAAVAANISERVEKQYRISRDRLMFNSSHTHCGPVIDRMLAVAYDLTPEQWADIRDYTRELEDKVVSVIGAALRDLRPAKLSFGHSQAAFAKNRRPQFNPNGPVDHDVPLLRVADRKGTIRATVFGYACHNTTIGAEFCQFNGDYAGFAQAALEKQNPGVLAFFVEGCGADANPSPRGTVELAREHGQTLAAAVEHVLRSPLDPVQGPLRTRFERVNIAFAKPPGREELQSRLQTGNAYVKKHARLMLDILDRGERLREDYPYPVQAWQFGRDLTLVALGGEVVVDYDLRLKRELGADRLWVAGYSNDVMGYIPSRRVLQEGGYEGGGAMIYYVQPGPWAPSVEDTIIGKVKDLLNGMQ